MSKQEEIIEVARKKVEARYSNDSRDCCGRCAFWVNTCTAEDDMMRIPCQKHDKDGKYAYFVLAERPKPIIIAQKSPANNTGADLDAEAERFLKTLPWRTNTPPIPDEYLDEKTYLAIARHFAEWERARIEPELRLAWGKISKDPFDADSVFKELLEHLKQ